MAASPEKTICFIMAVNDMDTAHEALAFIEALDVPAGMETDVQLVGYAPSMTRAYNEALKRNPTRYKIYLHQDVLILHRRILIEIVDLFRNHPQVGICGLIGARRLPDSGIWWESEALVGQVYGTLKGRVEKIDYGDPQGKWEPVQALDGFFLATQYDIPWREDLFTGWHFYDLSQCHEFRKQGYDAAVIRQGKTAWCLHDCGFKNSMDSAFERDRQTFVQHYLRNERKTP